MFARLRSNISRSSKVTCFHRSHFLSLIQAYYLKKNHTHIVKVN